MNAGIRLGLFVLLTPFGLSGQSFLEQFSYDGLRFSGIGIDGGRVWSDRLSAEWSPGIRIDYGLIAPRVRVVLGGSYFKGQLNPSEVADFEASLQGLVTPSNAVVSIGQIDWGTFESFVDLQYLMPTGGRVLSYVGLGLGVQLWNGSGDAINGTFVEDALDTIVAGMNGVVGVEVALSQSLRLMLEGRGGLTSELRTASTRFGLMYRLAPGSGN